MLLYKKNTSGSAEFVHGSTRTQDARWGKKESNGDTVVAALRVGVLLQIHMASANDDVVLHGGVGRTHAGVIARRARRRRTPTLRGLGECHAAVLDRVERCLVSREAKTDLDEN